LVLLAVLLASPFSRNAHAQPNPAISIEEDKACYRVVSNHLDAWNRGDVEAAVKDFTENVMVIEASGFATAYRDLYVKRLAELFKSTPKATRRRDVGSSHLRAVGSGAAVLTAVHEMTAGAEPQEKDGRQNGGTRFYLTYVLEKKGGRWWIASVHETEIKEPAAAK